ncbi:MAG TPA: lytic murein transglycosylase B [Gammaproteobacteria bacterium]|nr:lytic murein transglycosylase B [Gammaproteobacteria bacterium]
MIKKRIALGLLMASLLSSTSATIDRPELTAFINDMAAKHDFNSAELTRLFSQVNLRPDIIDAITRPAEAKPWYDYRPIFVTEARIAGGVEFWNQYADILARAQAAYGVPPEIIVAIIGVETRYGKNTGSYRVLDALSTLAFDYPKRSDFFRDELEQYLLLTREEKLDPLAIKGSYAGAMGMPQFIASSYRNFAVDFDNDGHRDLLNNLSDVIGSVANYFSAHKWQPDKPVAVSVQVMGDKYLPLINADLKPEVTLGQLKEQGVNVPGDLAPDQLGTLLEYEGDSGMEYWLGLQNFYVITRYNRSPLYAMAVYQLSNEIRARHDAQNQ